MIERDGSKSINMNICMGHGYFQERQNIAHFCDFVTGVLETSSYLASKTGYVTLLSVYTVVVM